MKLLDLLSLLVALGGSRGIQRRCVVGVNFIVISIGEHQAEISFDQGYQ